MNLKNDAFRKKLLETFKVEAEEHVAAMVSGLMELERNVQPEEQLPIIEGVFREAHSLKGAARAVNLTEVESRCQSLEGRLSELKRGALRISSELLDELHRMIDDLIALLRPEGLGKDRAETPRTTSAPSTAIPRRGEEEEGGVSSPEGIPVAQQRSLPVERSSGSGTVRITTAKLDTLFLQVEELLPAKLAAQHRAAELKETAAALAGWHRKHTELRPALQGIESVGTTASTERVAGGTKPHLEKILQYLEWENAAIRSLEAHFAAQSRTAEQDARFLSGKVDGLVEEMKRVLMLPFSSYLELFPKLVRDLSRGQGKDVEFEMQGLDVEADKRILEELKDPLVHLLRNAIDHGIEKPSIRVRKKKAPRGHVTLTVTPTDTGHIEVQIWDDGAGIELAQVRAAAVKQGVVLESEADKLDEEADLLLIFRSGISTSPIISEISGRGLGLAIVREKVEKLGGSVRVATQRGAGTVFRIVLPVTLATSRGILVRAGEQLFLLPTLGVVRVVRVGAKDIRMVENRETIEFGGKAVALIRLQDVLELPRRPAEEGGNGKHELLVLAASGTRVALRVDEILGEQEAVVKVLPQPFSQVHNLAGATVLGTGEVVPILSIADVVKSTSHPGRDSVAPEKGEVTPSKQKCILIAEDSITARSLLKGILESAGYAVRTAVDGADAFATLKTEMFDLVVSDVDMPRMSGFDLTAKIRADKKLSNLPVVLVTALGSREDRERGIDVGANAYIVKSSFQQSNLLEIIQRLI